MSIELTYAYFDAAFRYFADKKGYGFQTFIAQKAGVSAAFVSQLLRCTKKRCSFGFQVSIAEALGFTYEDFLRFGRELIEVQQTQRPSPNKEAENLVAAILKLLCNTNLPYLQRQKMALMESMQDSHNREFLEDLLNFLDAIQDWAADVYCIPE